MNHISVLTMSYKDLFFFLTVFWTMGFLFYFTKRPRMAHVFLAFGLISLISFNCYLWFFLKRPPLRTLGETRLFYATALPLIGTTLSYYASQRWVFFYSLLMSYVFLFINWLRLDIFDQTMMPALLSIWFIPHVIVYLFAYAFLTVSFLSSIKRLLIPFIIRKENKPIDPSKTEKVIDDSVRIGFSLLTIGLTFGALWAKEAWGHYWTWDPKETWAFLTWAAFLFYIHIRHQWPQKIKLSTLFIIFSFFVLMGAWFGVGYLPGTQNSVHSYGVGPIKN